MKKSLSRPVLAAVLTAASAGALLWRKYQADKAEQDLWAEVTDSVD